MGVLRFLLAMAVVLAHAPPGRFGPTLVDGSLAVQCFYMISGFYMGLILTEKYTGPGRYKLFFTNRVLRLYPAYLAVLAGTIGVWLVMDWKYRYPGPLGLFKSGLSPGATAALLATQVLIFGQELFLFFRRGPDGSLVPTTDFTKSNPQLWTYQLVPTAWSLSLELWFYLLAPLLTRASTRLLVIVGVASFGLRAFTYTGLGLSHDPWTYRFFPFELLFFVAGILAYRRFRSVRDGPPGRAVQTAVTAVVVALVFVYSRLPGSSAFAGFVPRQWAVYGLVWVALPYLFLWSDPRGDRFSRFRKTERWVGELSYPIYIVHFVIVQLVALKSQGRWPAGVACLVVIAIAIPASVVLMTCVMQPIDRVRDRRARSAAARIADESTAVVVP